jgi:hypothetical protein
MNIDQLTIGEAKTLAGMFPAQHTQQNPYKIGQAYLIRTVTHYYTGRMVAVCAQELILEDAAWIADQGRYAASFEKGELCEVEPIKGPCIIGRGAVIDAVEWPNALPRTTK